MGTEARIPTLSGHPSSFNPLALISGLVFHKFIRTFRPFVSLSGRQAGRQPGRTGALEDAGTKTLRRLVCGGQPASSGTIPSALQQ